MSRAELEKFASIQRSMSTCPPQTGGKLPQAATQRWSPITASNKITRICHIFVPATVFVDRISGGECERGWCIVYVSSFGHAIGRYRVGVKLNW